MRPASRLVARVFSPYIYEVLEKGGKFFPIHYFDPLSQNSSMKAQVFIPKLSYVYIYWFGLDFLDSKGVSPNPNRKSK